MERLSHIVGHFQPSEVAAATVTQRVTSGHVGGLAAVKELPPDAIFHVNNSYNADKSPNKINLGIGAYRDEQGKPYVLKVVRKAEDLINKDKSLNHEYFPITGHAEFAQAAQGLFFERHHAHRITSVQTLSGTGSLRVAAEFVKINFPGASVWIPNPTWGNHNTVFGKAGLPVKKYAYWDAKTRGLDLQGMLKDLESAKPGDVILLHACAHNPTGVDPTPEQWQKIAQVMKKKQLFPFVDSAYQGFASGSLDKDAFAVKHFTEQGFELLICQSFAKNMGLYNERIGACHVLCQNSDIAKAVKTQLAAIIRPMYSNPPAQGARVAHKILSDPELFSEWEGEMKEMSSRINKMRHELRSRLEKLGTPGTWEHITSQIGMFSFTGLTKQQALAIRSKHHVYMLENGRISMAGINSSNVDHLAKAINDVVRND